MNNDAIETWEVMSKKSWKNNRLRGEKREQGNRVYSYLMDMAGVASTAAQALAQPSYIIIIRPLVPVRGDQVQFELQGALGRRLRRTTQLALP
jgi:hypothetical protein